MGSIAIVATVLMTDIVDSTARALELGDGRWRDLLARHDHIVRDQLDRFRGREVTTTGDGFVAVFDGAERAIRAAQAIAAELAEIRVEIRAGIHSGELELQGGNVRGLTVHIAARIMAALSAQARSTTRGRPANCSPIRPSPSSIAASTT